jgi:hypothetical protein
MSVITAPLSDDKYALAARTVSPLAFYYVVAHHLTMRKPLSVVRMGDGEAILLQEQNDHEWPDDKVIDLFGAQWLKRMGMVGLTYGELRRRLQRSFRDCDWFAPSVTGLVISAYDVAQYFDVSTKAHIVDNFFVNRWTPEQIEHLLDLADGILLIHASAALADAMQKKHTRFKMQYLKLDSWVETETVIYLAKEYPHQLVLYSGGCGGKHIGPVLAKTGKVCIDVGNSMERFL